MVTERKLVERIRRQAPRSAAVVRGIGDDSAVLRVNPGHQLLVTTDLCIEDVHFRRAWHPAACVGHRCLARGLSDIAAMGGEPAACFLSLGLPPKLPQKWVDGFFAGMFDLARRFKVSLAGGDISSADNIVADIAVIGQVPSGKAVLRSGARPGDRIYVTGKLGGSAAVLQQLFAGKKIKPVRTDRHFYPRPRIEAGQWLRNHGATAMIDLSDGLSVDLAHICEESRVSALLDADCLPVAEGADVSLALHGGEDYELLFTASRKAKVPSKIAGLQITQIGEIRPASGPRTRVCLIGFDRQARSLQPAGWQHFAKA
ncbi:MAG TPA: thiamine-phosphate kinase [Verrucomicrobiae bacterium]|nr:thiamine-phosphate kinase [Verrucomicrobiae bacterium]